MTVQFSPYTFITQAVVSIVTTLDGEAWLSPYIPDTRKQLQFQYRSGYDVAKIYQSFWAYWKANGGLDEISGTLDHWREYAMDGNYPYPGTNLYDSPNFMTLSDENNIERSATGIPVVRSDLKNTPASLVGKTFNEYEVLA